MDVSNGRVNTTREYGYRLRCHRPTVGRMERHVDQPVEVDPGSLDSLVADCADVSREMLVLSAVVPEPRGVVSIPEGALTVVSGLGDYGD